MRAHCNNQDSLKLCPRVLSTWLSNGLASHSGTVPLTMMMMMMIWAAPCVDRALAGSHVFRPGHVSLRFISVARRQLGVRYCLCLGPTPTLGTDAALSHAPGQISVVSETPAKGDPELYAVPPSARSTGVHVIQHRDSRDVSGTGVHVSRAVTPPTFPLS